MRACAERAGLGVTRRGGLIRGCDTEGNFGVGAGRSGSMGVIGSGLGGLGGVDLVFLGSFGLGGGGGGTEHRSTAGNVA